MHSLIWVRYYKRSNKYRLSRFVDSPFIHEVEPSPDRSCIRWPRQIWTGRYDTSSPNKPKYDLWTVKVCTLNELPSVVFMSHMPGKCSAYKWHVQCVYPVSTEAYITLINFRVNIINYTSISRVILNNQTLLWFPCAPIIFSIYMWRNLWPQFAASLPLL